MDYDQLDEEQQQMYEESQAFKQEIERRFQRSLANKIYIFPRIRPDCESEDDVEISLSSDSDESLTSIIYYDLKQQNSKQVKKKKIVKNENDDNQVYYQKNKKQYTFRCNEFSDSEKEQEEQPQQIQYYGYQQKNSNTVQKKQNQKKGKIQNENSPSKPLKTEISFVQENKNQQNEKRLKTEGNDVYYNRFDDESDNRNLRFVESSELSEDVARLDTLNNEDDDEDLLKNNQMDRENSFISGKKIAPKVQGVLVSSVKNGSKVKQNNYFTTKNEEQISNKNIQRPISKKQYQNVLRMLEKSLQNINNNKTDNKENFRDKVSYTKQSNAKQQNINSIYGAYQNSSNSNNQFSIRPNLKDHKKNNYQQNMHIFQPTRLKTVDFDQRSTKPSLTDQLLMRNNSKDKPNTSSNKKNIQLQFPSQNNNFHSYKNQIQILKKQKKIG